MCGNSLPDLSDDEFAALSKAVSREQMRRAREKYKREHPTPGGNPLIGLLSEYTDRTDLSSLLRAGLGSGTTTPKSVQGGGG